MGDKTLFFPKFNQIWNVSYSHEWDMQQHIIGPDPWGHVEELKGQISLKFNYKVNTQIFSNQILSVFSQINDTKHIKPDFRSVTLVIPQGLDLGVLGVQSFNFLKMVMWHIKLKRMTR